jgi:hypothetical protein
MSAIDSRVELEVNANMHATRTNLDSVPVTGRAVRNWFAPFAFKHAPLIPMTSVQIKEAQHNVQLYVEACGDTEANLRWWPMWNEPFWDNQDYSKVNNCLAYSLLDRDNIYYRHGKPQPGDRGGCALKPPEDSKPKMRCHNLTDDDYRNHPDEIVRRLRNDYNSVDHELIFPEEEGMDPTTPPPHYYKAALLIAKTNGMYDYHFARMDSNGFWSHKPGATPVSNVDASGNLITDAKTADWYYDSENQGDAYNYDFYRYIFVSADAPRRARILHANFDLSDRQFATHPQLDYDPRKVHYRNTVAVNDRSSAETNVEANKVTTLYSGANVRNSDAIEEDDDA